MVDIGYNHNAIGNQKHFKPISNGNVADSGMVSSHFHAENLKRNVSLNVTLG